MRTTAFLLEKIISMYSKMLWKILKKKEKNMTKTMENFENEKSRNKM